MLSSRNDMADVRISLLQLMWLPTQDLHEMEPVKVPARMGRDFEISALEDKLLAVHGR